VDSREIQAGDSKEIAQEEEVVEDALVTTDQGEAEASEEAEEATEAQEEEAEAEDNSQKTWTRNLTSTSRKLEILLEVIFSLVKSFSDAEFGQGT